MFLHRARISLYRGYFPASMEASSRIQGQGYKVDMGIFSCRVFSGGADSWLFASESQSVQWHAHRSDCIEPYIVDGKTTARTIGASWIGDLNHLKADTSVPVLVRDQRYDHEQPQSLEAEDAEMLMGYPEGSKTLILQGVQLLRPIDFGHWVTLGICVHHLC